MEPEKFKLLFIVTLILSFILYIIIVVYKKNKGENAKDASFQLKSSFLIICIIASCFWFDNIDLKTKIIITTVAFGFGLLEFFFFKVINKNPNENSNIEIDRTKNVNLGKKCKK